jgi:hypothetical protein
MRAEGNEAEEVITEEHELGEAAAKAVKLTDRDRDLLGLLVLARYLTAAQVHRLAFHGKNLSLAYRRLLKLSNTKGQPPFVRQRFFRTYDGDRVAVWAATPYALPAALSRSPDLPELPKHDVGAQFLEHQLQLNELFLALWWSGGRCPRAAHSLFRWIPSDRVRLVWGEWEMREGRKQQRIIQPDAVLELPGQRRRYFLECEMGTQPIVNVEGNAQGATIAKAERYLTFLSEASGTDPRRTHYLVQFPDGFTPEVLFLVKTSGREGSVNAALREWGAKQPPRRPAMRAVVFEDAAVELRRLAGLPPADAATPRESTPSARPPLSTDERSLLRRYVEDSVRSIKRARAVFRELRREDLPAYPADFEAVRALIDRLGAPRP